MLSVKEMKELKKLQDKHAEYPLPLNEESLDQMEIRALNVLDASILEDMQEFYSRVCHRSHALAKDNRILIAQVRMYQAR